MYDDFIDDRISKLREKGVSARDMSLSLGQGVNYINTIENHRALPSIFIAPCTEFCRELNNF